MGTGNATPAPGADDNATGVALVLESARLLAGQRFPWSILFIAWSGEELGLLGSQAYVTLAAARDDPILGVLNFDMIGFNDLQQRLEIVTNLGSRWLGDQMASVAERYAIDLNIDLLEDGGARLSDHAPFWSRGYDAILGIENYLPTDSTTYGVREGRYRINSQYHSVADLPDSINWGLVRRTTQLTVATLAEYGLGEGTPNLAVFTRRPARRPHGRPPRPRQQHRAGRGRQQLLGAGLAMCAGLQPVRGHPPRTGGLGGIGPGRERGRAHSLQRFGEMVFLIEVDAEGQIGEVSEADNHVFQRLRLVPQSKIAVFPNPFRIGNGSVLRFSGVPLKSAVAGLWARRRSSVGSN